MQSDQDFSLIHQKEVLIKIYQNKLIKPQEELSHINSLIIMMINLQNLPIGSSTRIDTVGKVTHAFFISSIIISIMMTTTCISLLTYNFNYEKNSNSYYETINFATSLIFTLGILFYSLKLFIDFLKYESSIHTPAIDTPVLKFSENLIRLDNFKATLTQCKINDNFKSCNLDEKSTVRTVLTAAMDLKNSLEMEISKIDTVLSAIKDIPIEISPPIRNQLFNATAATDAKAAEDSKVAYSLLPTSTSP